MPAPRTTPAGVLMPACQNCGNTASFVVTLAITTTYAAGRLDPPRLHADVQCRRCDSTHVDGDPYVLLRRAAP